MCGPWTYVGAHIHAYMAKQGEPKTAWGQHVRAWMASHPGVAYKEALQQAKSTYPKAGKVTAPPVAVMRAAPKVAKVAKAKVAKRAVAPKVAKMGQLTPWQEHVAGIRSSRPGLGLKEAMIAAKETYKRHGFGGETKEVVPVVAAEAKKVTKLIGGGLAEVPRVEAKEMAKVAPVVEVEEPVAVMPTSQAIAMAVPAARLRPCGCGRRGRCKCEERMCRQECCEY
jgi:hypothetical protein